MSYRITGLDPAPFRNLFGLPERKLAKLNVKRVVADAKPGYPDRVELRDAEPGETLLLLNYLHQPAETPYKSGHAIFVREGAVTAYKGVDAIPECLRLRPISLRAFDISGMMVDADLGERGRGRRRHRAPAREPRGELYPRPLRQARLLRCEDRSGLKRRGAPERRAVARQSWRAAIKPCAAPRHRRFRSTSGTAGREPRPPAAFQFARDGLRSLARG